MMHGPLSSSFNSSHFRRMIGFAKRTGGKDEGRIAKSLWFKEKLGIRDLRGGFVHFSFLKPLLTSSK